MALTPDEVFTPATPVRDDMFATRRHEHLQDRLDDALGQRGRQVVLYGPTGVGKTSLVRYLSNQREIPMVRVECGPPFEKLMRDALGKIIGEEEIERIETSTGEAEFGASVWAFITAKGKLSEGTQTKYAKVPRTISGMVAETLDLLGYHVLFLDNFENLADKEHGPQTARQISELLKLFSDRSADAEDDVKAVVAGIPEASEQLIALDGATARRTAQIEVGRMPPDELDEILKTGGEKLGVEFEGFCRERIVQFSDGFPYYTHLYALHCARRAMRDGRDHVTIEDFEASLDEILADTDLSLRRSYQEAVETSGDVRVRKSVMEAMALLNDVEVPFKAIRESFLKIHPRYETPDRLNFISTYIAPLKDEYGILSDRGRPKSRNNLYRFTNPLMRAYVRLQMHKEKQPALFAASPIDAAKRS
jgi:Cdc6-like AAA superfamily ATPase